MASRWYQGLSRAQWSVLAIACLGWMFDTFDQRLFILTRASALAALAPSGQSPASITALGTYITAVFIAGWATGGVIFGVYGDRWGRVRTMAATIVLYSLFTGLSACAVGVWDYGLYRFLTGLGIGGEFAAGVALVAEVMPERSRPYALGLMQAMAVVGTFLGTALTMVFAVGSTYGGLAGWRWLYLCGALPALLLVFLRRGLDESVAWTTVQQEALATGTRLGGLAQLWTDPRWRRRSICGVLLGFAGQLGIWGIGTWTPELMRGVLAGDPTLNPAAQAQVLGWGLMLKDVASIAGIFVFTYAAARFGRRPAFAVAFVASLLAAVFVFAKMESSADIWWMMPLLGFTVWSALGGYAIYFPELYPTRLRASGTGLCYNAARYLTALGIVGLGQGLLFFAQLGYREPLRPAAIAVSSVYLIGLVALFWAPETRGKGLPE